MRSFILLFIICACLMSSVTAATMDICDFTLMKILPLCVFKKVGKIKVGKIF